MNETKEGFLIVTDSRKKSELLFMVDRSKQRASFWSDRLDDALVYANKSAADRKAASLKFNNPRVIPFGEAVRRVGEPFERTNQELLERHHQEALDEAEQGWDAHKGWW